MQTDFRKMNLQDLVNNLREQNLKKQDYVVPSNCLSFERGLLVVRNTNGTENTALSQLLNNTGISTSDANGSLLTLTPLEQFHVLMANKQDIPLGYYKRMLTGKDGKDLPLLDSNVNHWLQQANTNYFLRTFVDKTESAGYARALLSDRYGVIDNYDVLFAALDAVKDSGINIQIETADITEKKMYVRFICPDIEVNAPELLKNYRVPGGSPDQGKTGIISGFVISNSEVGAGGFSISPRAVVLACKNGMIFKDDAFSRVHLGGKMEEYTQIKWSEETKRKNMDLIVSQVKDAIKTYASLGYLQGKVQNLIEQGAVELKHPTDAVKNVCRVQQFTNEQEADILNFFIKGADTTAFGITQAITYYAHSKADADQQYEMELAATGVLNDVKAIDKPFVEGRKSKAAKVSNAQLN